jgi:MoxR-like ATPase
MAATWPLFTGDKMHMGGAGVQLPPAPPWRVFDPVPPAQEWRPTVTAADPYWNRARSYRVPAEALGAINAALALRRPLLVTGAPGTGKTTLAYRVAYELGLGPVLEWPVNSRSRVKDALYEYDALGRLQDQQRNPGGATGPGPYITLRALGTALLPATQPRVLLIDEIDKADPDLPNDLLNLFEEGSFEIPELVRENTRATHIRPMLPARLGTGPDRALPAGDTVEIIDGKVRCHQFPFIVLTSNGEREFPPAFLRRCIRVSMPDPDVDQLTRIVEAHLGQDISEAAYSVIEGFAAKNGTIATDQLLNMIFLSHGAYTDAQADQRAELERILAQPIRRS